MAYTKVIADLRQDCRDRGDIQGNATDGFVLDAELDRWINLALGELYDLIVSVEKDRFVTTATLNVAAGGTSIALPADFYRLLWVALKDSQGNWRKLQRFNLDEQLLGQGNPSREHTRYRMINGSLWLRPIPDWTETGGVQILYIPAPPVLSGATTFDFHAAWHEYLINRVCVMHCAKEESDPSIFQMQLVEQRARIVSMAATLDDNEPERTRDVLSEGLDDYWPDYDHP